MKVNQRNAGPLSAQEDPELPPSQRGGGWLRPAFIAARLFMAGVFIYASIEKIAHPAAFAKDVYNYQILPDTLINLTALALPWLELFLGLCLLAGFWMAGSVLTVNGLLVVFLAAFVFNLARGLNVDCGCFGAGGLGPSMATHWYLLRDAGFLAVGAFLLFVVFGNRRRKVPERADPSRESRPGWGQAAWQASALVVVSAVAALAVNAQRADRLPLVGDWSVAGRITTEAGERIDISLAEAQQLFTAQAAVFIDARPAADYARGHIRGARSLPWHDVDRKFIDVTQDLELENPIVTYCDGQTCELSHNLALFLREAGFANTRVLVDGWKLWQQSGGPVASGTRPAQP